MPVHEGLIHVVYDWDWAAAERELQQVATLAPAAQTGQSANALLSLSLGHWEDALRQVKASLAEDAINPSTLVPLSWVQARRGHLPEAEAAMRPALDIHPTLMRSRTLRSPSSKCTGTETRS